jgi:hypothetical protein
MFNFLWSFLMQNLKNRFLLVSSLAAVLSVSCVTAEAGVSRSLGGHSAMGNRSAGHNVGSRAVGSSGKFTVSHVGRSSGFSGHSTTVANNTTGNSIQHAGNFSQASTSNDQNQHERIRTVTMNGQTSGIDATTAVGSLGEGTGKGKIDHEVTTKHGSVFRDRRTVLTTSDTTGSVVEGMHSSSSLLQNSAGEMVKTYSKNTTITPGSKNPVHHHGNVLSTPESDLS